MAVRDGGSAAPTRPREVELLRAATRLFRERGFHATSMQDLADDLGMNRGSLYHYIESKDDLLWWVVDDAMQRLRASVEAILQAEAPAAERLRDAIRAHLAFAAHDGDEMWLIQIEARSLSPDRRVRLLDQRDAYERAWRTTLQAAVDEGSVRSTDVRLTGIAILSVCNWFTQWYRPDGPLGVDEIATAFSSLFVSPTS